MCFKMKTVSSSSSATEEADEESSTNAKARLLATEGENNGEKLSSSQTSSIRKIFGN